MEGDLNLKFTFYSGKENKLLVQNENGTSYLSRTYGMNLSFRCYLEKNFNFNKIKSFFGKICKAFSNDDV